MKTTVKVAMVLLFLIIIIVAFMPGTRLSIMPGPEGLQVGVWGFQPDSTVLGAYSTNQTLPIPFAWGQQPVDPYNALILRNPQPGEYAPDYRGVMLVERQQPYPETGSASRQITYYVKVSENQTHITWQKVVGIVVPWTFTLQISLRPQADSYYAWRNHAVWLAMGTIKWNRAYSDPDDPSKSSDAGWSIPLSVYIENYDPTGGGWVNQDGTQKKVPPPDWISQVCVLTPDFSGRTITLYDNPNQMVTLDDLWYKGMDGLPYFATLNESVAPSLYPDTRFKNAVYFRFTFTDFRPYMVYNLGQLTEVWYPSVSYRIRVYYLELGEFTYIQQKEEIPQWEQRGWTQIFMPAYYFIDSIFKALNILNPFAVFGPFAGLVAFIFLLVIAFIIGIILLAIFFPGAFARLTGALTKAKH